MRRLLIAIVFALVLWGPNGDTLAVEPGEILKDPALEQRARELSKGLRCLVCQNQSIDDSNAPLAKDLRVLVRERLTAGDSNDEVIDFVVARYGEFVLLNPRLTYQTLVLWLAAPVLLLLSILTIYLAYRRRARQTRSKSTQKLTPEEQARLNELLEDS